jgi:hypothetical protein
MNWPWVSRARLEDVERRLAESEAERRALTERLLDRMEAPQPVKTVSVEEDSSPLPYTTPMDSVLRRFDKAGANARKPQFKAKVR